MCDPFLRTMVRRQEMLQKYVERCEETLSAKAEAKDVLTKEVFVCVCLSVFVGLIYPNYNKNRNACNETKQLCVLDLDCLVNEE